MEGSYIFSIYKNKKLRKLKNSYKSKVTTLIF